MNLLLMVFILLHCLCCSSNPGHKPDICASFLSQIAALQIYLPQTIKAPATCRLGDISSARCHWVVCGGVYAQEAGSGKRTR